MLSNEEVRQIRDNTNTQIEANNAALLRQQEELHKALRETYGQDGVDTYNTIENAKAILARDDAPDALLWDSARESAKSYARWMKMPLPTSETLDDWNVERKPFANGREALERIVTIFQNPAAMFDSRYKAMAKAQAEGTLTPQSLVEMAQGAGYKAKDLSEFEIGQHLGKEDREAFEGLRAAYGRATYSQSSRPGTLAGGMAANPEQEAADIKAYQDALPGYLKKAQDAELAQRYQAETIADNALAIWTSAADGLSPSSNELLRRAFVGGKDGIEIDNSLVKEHLRYLNKEGSLRTGWTAEQQALYRASMDSGDWSKVDNATLFAKIPREELDSVLMLMGAARGTLRESQFWTDTGRRVWESTKRPIEGVMDFFTFGYVHVDEATAEIAKRRNATALDVMASDTRQQIALRHALEDATAPLMYEDYGEAYRAFMVFLEQFPTMAYMVGVPFVATVATAPIGGVGGKVASAAVMSAYAMSYAADTREYALREGASLLSANLMGIGSGIMQALLENSKIEAFYGKGLTEAYFKAAMGSASKRMAQVLGGKIVGKYGSLELFKAALESGSALAVNGALETIQEGLQKGAEEVSKNVALKIDGQDVRIFDGVQAAVSKEMADVAAGMFLTQAGTSALGNVKNVAAGSALIKNMAILRGGLFQAMQQGAPISEARLNLMNSPEAQQEMKAKWLGLQNASRGERVNMLMRDYHLSNDEAMSVDSTMSAFKNIVNRNKAQAAQLIAEYVINGNSNIEPLLTQNGATSTVTNDNLSERFKAAFAAIGITDVEIEEATGTNLGEKNEGKFVLTFGKGDVQYTFGIDNNMGDPASAGFASSAQEELLRVGAPEANVSAVAFISRWTRDEAFRDEMMKKYNLKAAGRYTPTRARLRAVDTDGNTYTADVDGIISLAIGERATTQTVVHETMHMLLRVVRDLEVIQGADSVMDETTKRTLLQAFSPNLLQQYDEARKAGKDNFFELFLANAKAEEEFANIAMRGATTHNVTTAQEIISQSAKQNVSGAIDWLRMMGGKMLDAFLGTDEWRVVLDDNGLGALVGGLTGDVIQQQGVSHVIDTLSKGVLNATKAQDTYHEAREQERKARWDREALALRQRVQEAIQRKQALRQQMAQAEADAALYEQLEAEAVALDTEIAKAEEDFNAAVGEQAAADEAMRERAQAVAAYKVNQAQQQYARAMDDYAYYYREQIATLPKKANGKPDMTRAQRDRLSVENMLVRDAKQAYREAVRKAAETGDPGAIYEARKLDIQEAFDKAVADTVTWLRGEEAVIDATRVSNWENLGLTRVLGQFTLESKTAYIERRMREYGESREQATAQADGLYPTDGGLSVPWLNRELYGDGTGGSSPDEVAQAMYNEGRISEPDAEVLWEAIRGDVESLQAYKTREKEHVRSQFVEAVEQMNEERARNLAYLESEAEMGRYSVTSAGLNPNPNLREDIEAALAKRSAEHPEVIQRGRHEDIVFSEAIPFFEFLGLPSHRVVSDVAHVRKLSLKHHLSVDDIADLSNLYNNPVAVMRDGDSVVLLTDRLCETDDGEQKPLHIVLRQKTWRSGEVVFLSTALSETAAGETKYYEPLLKSGLLFADEKRIAGLHLEEETESILHTQASGNYVLSNWDYSQWLTRHTIPHSGADVNENRFSVSARRPDLVGLHNMSAEGLKGADDLGGFAMPSIAITRDSMGHNEFGDISLLMRTSSFDPKVNRMNKIYSRDAWTPTFPGIINKVDAARMVRVSERLLDTLPADLRKAYAHGDTYSLLYEDGVNDAFKTVNTASEYYRHNAALKAAYLVSKGETLQPVMKPKSFLGRSSGRILALGEEGLRLINESIGDLLFAFHSVPVAEHDAWIEQHASEIEAAFIDAAYASRVAKNPAVAEYSKEEIYGDLFKKNPLGFADVIDLANAVDALRKAMAKGEADAQIVDEYATKRAVNDRVSSDDADFIAWLDEQYGNPVLARGIRNNKDFYTPSGGRRSWDALHEPVTLSNVVKNMLSKQREQGEGFLGANPFGLAAAKLNSFKDVIKHEDLLKELPKEEMDAIRDEFIAAFNEISARYLNTWKYQDDNPFTASARSDEALLDAWAASKGSFAGLKRELNGYGRTASDDLIRDLQEVMNGIAKFPTKYFEAKPMRAVGFEEVAAAIIPDNTTEETREILARRGVPVYEYAAGNDTSRLAALNMAADDVEGTRFSVRAKASTEQLDLFMDYLPDYAKRNQLDAKAQQEMKSLAENAFKLSDETRDIWREALKLTKKGAWKKAWSTEEANREKYPTVARTIIEAYSGKKDFGTEVRGLQIESAEDIAMMMMALRSPYQELMKAVYLDKDKRVLDARVLTIGIAGRTVISSHVVFGNMPEGTESVILSHNHPSGMTEPSEDDIRTTGVLNASAEAVGVKLLDHVITNGTTYYSFRDQTDHDLPEAKHDLAAWEVGKSVELGGAVLTPSRVAEIVRLVQQHGNETVLLGLDRRRRVEFVRLLPAELMLADTEEAKQERQREIIGYAFRRNASTIILYASPTNSYDRDTFYADHDKILKSVIPLEFAAANLNMPIMDVILRDDISEPSYYSMRTHNELMLPGARSKPMETGGSRYAVSARPMRLDTLPASMDSVLTTTSVKPMTHMGFKDPRGKDRQYAETLAQSSDKVQAEKGKYLLAKYHNDPSAADETVMRALHIRKPEDFEKNEAIQALRKIVDDQGDKPVVFVPLVNAEAARHNLLPWAYAATLAIYFGKPLYGGTTKTSEDSNTRKQNEERVKAQMTFADAGGLPSDARVILVDDVFTSGSSLRNVASFIKQTYPNVEIVAATALAVGRRGKAFRPTEKTMQAVLDFGKMTAEVFQEITGHDIRTYTETELRRFLHGRKHGGRDAVAAYFQDLRADDGAGATRVSAAGTARGDGGIEKDLRGTRLEDAGSARSVNYHVTSRPDLTQLNEQHAAAQARLAKAEKRMRKANTSYRIQSQAAMRDGFGAMPNVNDMVSHPMLEYTIGAIAMNSGHKVNPRDVQKFAKDFGLTVDARSAKESADRINESVWGKAGRASKMNKSLIMRGKQRSPFERLSALGAILESEANEPDREKRVQDEMAKIMGYARGAQSARTVSKDARILRETKAQEILAQTGYSAETIEQWCGFDLVDTILEMQDALSRMSKDDIEAVIARRQKAAEERKNRELEEAASGTELKSEITAEQQAIWEELQKRLVELTRRRAALEEERRKEAKKAAEERKNRESEDQRQQKAKKRRQKQKNGEIDLVEATEDLIPQSFDVGGRTIDLMDPADLVWFVENMVAYKMLQEEAATEADLAALSVDEKYIRNLALTLGSVIERLANGMVYSLARENVMKAITDLGYAGTLRQVELIGIKALSTLHASRIRTQRKAIIKAMLEGGEVDVGSETITLVGIKQAVEKGRLVVGRSDLDRKVTGDVEARLKAIKKVIKAGDTEQARLEADARQKLEALGKTAGLDNEEIMRDYQDARRIQAALNTYGGLTHRTIAELVDIAEELSRQINGELEAHERRKAEAQAKHDADVQTVVAACAADAKKYKPTDDNKTWRERAADWLDRGNGLLNIVLGRIGRNTVGDVRNAWERLSNDIQAKFAGSAQKERVLIDGYNARVAEIMTAAYGSQRNGVNRLNELIPEDLNEIITAQIQRDKDGNPIPGKQAHQKTRMTVGQVLQLWLSIKQQDYKDNAVLWGRDGAAFKAIESCLAAEDVAFASQAQKLLKDIFPELRETYRKIVGYSVGTTPDYWPVKIHMERDSRPADVRVYSPFVAAMQPRTRHGLDFDESADALSMLTSRLNEYAHMQAYGEMAEELVELFGDHKLRRAIKNTYGDEYMAQLDAKLQDTLLGPRMQYSAIGSNLVALTSVCSMGFNLNSVFKQLFSFGSMANRVGLRGMAKFFAENMFDFSSPEAEYLRNSTAWKSRYGKSTQNAVFEQLMRGTGKMSKASIVRNQIINAGFKPIMWADWLASRNVALGFFKMRKAQLVDEGMAETDAMERASVETIDLVETTMQTGQTHHQSQNSKSEMFKLLSQFQNALVQQGEYMKVDVAKILRGERGGLKGLGRTAARYAVTGALIQIANGILQAIYGDGIMDDDDEEAKQAWYAMCAEMVSSMFLPVTATPLVGGVATWAINYAVGESDTLNSYDLKNEFVPPAFSTIERTFSGAIDVGYAFAGEEDWAYALHKLGKAMSAPYRSAARFAEGQLDVEPPKKQR